MQVLSPGTRVIFANRPDPIPMNVLPDGKTVLVHLVALHFIVD